MTDNGNNKSSNQQTSVIYLPFSMLQFLSNIRKYHFPAVCLQHRLDNDFNFLSYASPGISNNHHCSVGHIRQRLALFLPFLHQRKFQMITGKKA